MNTRKFVIAKDGVSAPKGPYSHAVIAGNHVFVSGMGPINAEKGNVAAGGIHEQTIQTLENIRAVLKSVGVAMEDIVKVNVFLRNIEDFQLFNSAYSRFFKEGNYPARTTVQSVIPNPKALVEIDVVAYIESG